MNDQEPDDEEKSIRFGCGAVFGAFAGVMFALEIGAPSYGVLALIMVVAVLLCGQLAVRYGDRFWAVVFTFFSW